MIARGALRGGLIGALLSVAFSVLGVIPVCGYVAMPLRLAAWTVGGYFGGRTALKGGSRNAAVAAGLAAGLLAGLIDGVANIVLAPVRYKLAGDMLTSLHLLPSGILDLFKSLGLDLMTMDTVGGSVFFAVLLCGITWAVAAFMGALGGAISQALAD